jgi:hypothetical protein
MAPAGESTRTAPVNNNQARYFMAILQENSIKPRPVASVAEDEIELCEKHLG